MTDTNQAAEHAVPAAALPQAPRFGEQAGISTQHTQQEQGGA